MLSHLIKGTERVTTHHVRCIRVFGVRIPIWKWTTIVERPFTASS